MRKLLFLLLFPLLIVACKNKEARSYELVTQINDDKEALATDSLRHTKAYILDKKNIALDFVFATGEESLTEPIANQLSDVLSQISEKYPECQKLLKDGMNFKTRVYNKYGIKIQEHPLEADSEGQLKIQL